MSANKHQIIILQPACPIVERIASALEKKGENEVYRVSSAAECIQVAMQSSPCLILLSSYTRQDIQQHTAFLKGARNLILGKLIKTIAISKHNERKLIDLYLKLGCNEFLGENLSDYAIYFKINLHLKALRARKLQQDQEDLVMAARQDSTSGSQRAGSGASKEVRESAALQLADDLWLIRGEKPRRFGKNWIVSMEGPDPASGDWEEAGTSTEGEKLWRWKPRNEDGSLDPTPKPEGWVFTGQKPIFNPEKGKWNLISPKPDLSYIGPNGKAGSKIETSAEGALVVAKDSARAEKNILKSRATGMVARGLKLAAESAEKAAKEKEKEKLKRGIESLDDEQNPSSIAPEDKTASASDRAGSSKADVSPQDTASGSVAGKNKPIPELDDDFNNKNKLKDALSRDSAGASQKGGSKRSDENTDQRLNESGGSDDKVARDLKAIQDTHSSQGIDENESSVSVSSQSAQRKSNKSAALDSSKASDSSSASASEEKAREKDLAKAQRLLDEISASSSSNLSSKDKTNASSQTSQSESRSENSTDRNSAAQSASQDTSQGAIKQKSKSLDSVQESESGSDSAQSQSKSDGVSTSQASQSNPTGSSTSASAATSTASSSSSSPTANSKPGNDPFTSANAITDRVEKSGRAWKPDVAKTRDSTTDDPLDAKKNSKPLKKRRVKKKGENAERKLLEAASELVAPEPGLWKNVEQAGFVYVTPKMQGQSSESIRKMNSFSYIDNPSAPAPFFHAKDNAWMFDESAEPKWVSRFEDLPKAFQDFLIQQVAKNRDPMQAALDTEAALKSEAERTQAELDSIAEKSDPAEAVDAREFLEARRKEREARKIRNAPTPDHAAVTGKDALSSTSFLIQLSDRRSTGSSVESDCLWAFETIRKLLNQEQMALFQFNTSDIKAAKIIASTDPRFKVQESVDLQQAAPFIQDPNWKGFALPLRASFPRSAPPQQSGVLLLEAGKEPLSAAQLRFLHEISRPLGLMLLQRLSDVPQTMLRQP